MRLSKVAVLAAALAVTASGAFAGGMAEPIIEPEVVAEKASSSAGIIVPLLLLILVAVAVSGGGGDDRGRDVLNPNM